MLNNKELIKFVNEVLSDSGVQAPPLDVRTLRYYITYGLVKKPALLGRENYYDVGQAKQLIALKILQSDRLSLAQIKTSGVPLDEVIRKCSDPKSIEQSFDSISNNRPTPPEGKATQEEEPVLVNINQEEVDTVVEEAEMAQAAKPESAVTISVTNQADYNELFPFLKVGSSFLFADKVTGPASAKLYALINGQRAGAGSIKRAVMAVADSFFIPGAMVTSADQTRQVSLILSDKDIYREGHDVAKLFLFCPMASGEKGVAVGVSLDGAALDSMTVDMDENGCGMVMVPTLVSGTYLVEALGKGWSSSHTFEAARYELAPFVVTLGGIKKDGNIITAEFNAESFSSPFSGDVRMELIEQEKVVNVVHAKFEEGKASGAFSASGTTESLSIRVINLAKPALIANVPLPGSRKSEMDLTEMSRMGSIVSVSLMPTQGSIPAMGLHFTKSGKTNSPISLCSCVASTAELRFNSDASDVTIIVRDVSSGKAVVKELGDVKGGTLERVQLDGSLSVIHVGAFVGDEPWEGHGAVIKAAGKGVSIKTAERINPGDTMEISVKGPKGASVLLKVVDKRLRVQYEPMIKAAAIIKDAVAAVMFNRRTGKVMLSPPPSYALPGYAAGMSPLGGSNFESFGYSSPLRTVATRQSMTSQRSKFFSGGRQQSMTSQSRQGLVPPSSSRNMAQSFSNESAMCSSFVDSSYEAPMASYFVQPDVSHSGLMNELQSHFDMVDGRVDRSLYQLSPDCAPVAPPTRVREVEADVIYCDLIKANKKVVIQVPDVIGDYDVRAFCVSKGRWTEAVASVRVEKECFIEPLIPAVCHPEDEMRCEAIVVRPPKNDEEYEILVDGRHALVHLDVHNTPNGNVRLSWDAIPGLHQVSVSSGGKPLDVIRRIIQKPGEEIVLTQEMRILMAGQYFDASEEDALSVKVMPGMEQETKLAIAVLTDFGHACCEQSAAMITAAALSLFLGDDSSKEKAAQLIVKGEARMRAMWARGKGFNTYPETPGIYPNWSATAGRRLANFKPLLEKSLDQNVRKAVLGLIEMGEDVVAAHKGNDRTPAPMEDAYYGKLDSLATKEQIVTLKGSLSGNSYYSNKSEAAFAAASLIRAGKFELGIDLANAVAKSMGGMMGGGTHGSYEALAYMHMVEELRNAGVVSGSGSGSVLVDGKKMSMKSALKENEATTIQAIDSAVAIKINSIRKINMMEYRDGIQMTIELNSDHAPVELSNEESVHGDGSRWDEIHMSSLPKAGGLMTMKVTLPDGYVAGDMLCVVLPDCMSRVVSGAKVKKFQLDFKGKNSLEVDLVCHGATPKPQTWAAVVRNMYDAKRIGCVGLMRSKVS